MSDQAHSHRNGKSDKRYDAESVRQGEIILRTRQRRVVFLAGLAGMALLVLMLALWAAP